MGLRSHSEPAAETVAQAILASQECLRRGFQSDGTAGREQVGLDDIQAEVLPDQKAAVLSDSSPRVMSWRVP